MLQCYKCYNVTFSIYELCNIVTVGNVTPLEHQNPYLLLTLSIVNKKKHIDRPNQYVFCMTYITDTGFKDVGVLEGLNTQLSLSPYLPSQHSNCEKVITSTKKRIDECSKQAYHITRECDKCGTKYVTYGHCFIRYCEHCVSSRIGRAKKNLKETMAHYPGVLNHLILTMPESRYSRENKKFLENSKRKFFQELRRDGFKFQAVGVFDYGNPKTQDSLETNIHIHVALDLPGSFYLRYAYLQKLWANATGIDNAVIRCVKARKTAVIRYFSRRIAGDYGHGSEIVLLQEFMSVEQFDTLIRGSRYFSVSLPKGISSKRSSQLSQKHEQKCKCGGILRLLRVTYMGEVVKDDIIYCERGISLIGIPTRYLNSTEVL